MKARLHTPNYRFHFQGSPLIWNEYFRPLLGGPAAPAEPVAPAPSARAPQAAVPAEAGVAVLSPPRPATTPSAWPAPPVAERVPSWQRGPQERSFTGTPGPSTMHSSMQRGPSDGPRVWTRRPGGLEPTLAVEPSGDPRTLYDRLSNVESRRGERDAVLAAIWFLGRGEKDVAPEEVERHLRDHGGPTDVKVRPVMLKHVTRTKLLEQGGTPGTVRLTQKGAAQARMLVGA